MLLLLASRTLLRQRRQRARAAQDGETRDDVNGDGSGRFHALSIRIGTGACKRARQLHGRRFLSPDAPMLPLADCDTEHCRCRFVHHRDRRRGEDRRSPFQGGFGGSATRIERDRRDARDRRGDEGALRAD